MTTTFRSSRGLRLAALLLGAIVAVAATPPAAARAQEVPSYATPAGDEQIRGTIQSIDGKFEIRVWDSRGFVDDVALHQGTIINPLGLTLAPGMSVTILGYNAGATFAANEIDAPYRYSGPPPVAVYYGPDFWYPGFALGYGPSFSLVFVGGPYLVQRPWAGSWYAPAPVRGYVYRAPSQPVAVNRAYPLARGRAPGVSRPESRSVPGEFAPRAAASVQRGAGRSFGEGRSEGHRR